MPIDNDSKINYPVTKAIAVGMENGSTVEYAINSIKMDLPYKGTVPTGTDILTLNIPGVYLLASDHTYTNCPTSFGVLEIVKHEANPNQVLRMYRVTDEEAIYTRYYVSDSETGEWNKQPTRDELDTITENMVLADFDSPIDTGNVNLYYTKTEVDNKDSALSTRIDGLTITKADKSSTVSDVSYDTTAKKITKTVNGTTSDIVTAATLKTDMALDNVGNFKAVSTVANQGLSETEKSNARSNIGAGNSSFSGSYNDLTDKPTLGTAAAKDVPLSGNASTSQVVMGNDTRLTDSRNAKDVYTWAKASTKPSYTASEVGAIPSSSKGANNGVAELDSAGKVPSSQLPSYVDDVIEANSMSDFPATGETGKIYIAKDTNKTYRWSGTGYVEISASLALGTTSSTAYRGDYGNAAYTHAVTNKGSAFTSGLYKIATNAEGHVTGATSVSKSDITALGIPGSDTNTHRPIQVNGTEVLGNNTTPLNLKAGSNVTLSNNNGEVTVSATDTTYSNATTSTSGLMSSADKTKFDDMATISYGTCQTAAATAAKAVTLTNANWQLKAGSIVGVDFTYTNTASASSSSPITLNVNGSGAKTIRYNHAIIAGAIPEAYGLGGHSIFYIYDGTYWNWLSIDRLSYRPIQVNGTEVYAGDNILPLKLKNGSNVDMSYSNGEVTVSATDTTYSNATTSTSGLMSSADKTKFDDMYEGMLIADLDSPIDTGNVNLYYTKTEVDAKDSALSGRIDTLNSKQTLDSSFNHTRIPVNSDFDSYTTPGVYYVSNDSDATTMNNIPRTASGKLIVMARHSDAYLVQYYYPSTSIFIRYVRSYINGAWHVWIREENNYYNNQTKVYDCGKLSSASDKTFEQLGLSIYQYGAYFVVLRGDSAVDASWVGIVRHNSAGYQITQIYKGAPTNTAYIDSNGIVKTNNSAGLNTVAFVQPLLTWGNVM